ncbi:hypothetical protein PAGA_a2626 [Pseudoalteromonas agarivorans DSM 14585]|uniref:Uncharacterized protein n=1 Tax=Pseudoalteromonas agarivorans DSM 14585 TaxID=1312369 RepID=A0ACA8DXX0_9GAMM|nr:hypothetical protein PAGA_a2626 [Pseudoalteromonas agarivorans DSM 14585]
MQTNLKITIKNQPTQPNQLKRISISALFTVLLNTLRLFRQ